MSGDEFQAEEERYWMTTQLGLEEAVRLYDRYRIAGHATILFRNLDTYLVSANCREGEHTVAGEQADIRTENTIVGSEKVGECIRTYSIVRASPRRNWGADYEAEV